MTKSTQASSDILQEIEDFLETSGMPKTVFGIKAVNDGWLVSNLRDGRRLWPETELKIREFLVKPIRN